MSKIRFRGYNRVKFQSLKLGRTVLCQSLLLRDYLLHLEWDDSIHSYELSPFKIAYKAAGIRKLFRPHLLIKQADHRELVIWLRSAVSDEECHLRFVRLMTGICEQNNFIFAVKTSAEIRKEPGFSNLKFLRRYHRCEISLKHTILCNELFDKVSNPSLGELIEFFRAGNENAETAYALIAQKIIEADLYISPIDNDTPIKLARKFPHFQNGRLKS